MKKQRYVNFRTPIAGVGLMATLVLLGSIVGKSIVLAVPAPVGDKSAKVEEKRPGIDVLTLAEGNVLEHSKNKPGDVDGFKLSAGPAIHFPPHLGEELRQLIPVGSTVRVFGTMKSRKDGSEVLEAVLIDFNGRGFFIAPKKPKPEPISPHADHRNEEKVHVMGRIEEFHANKGGDVDGFRLAENADDVRFPPHLGAQVQQLAKIGDLVRVAARKHVTPKGEIHLHVDKIEIGDKSVTVEHHAKGDRSKPAAPKHDDGGSHQEIMRELREIRTLIESLKK